MWAILDKTNQQVVGYLEPIADQEAIDKTLETHDLIEMTLENSPAYIGGYYSNGRFTDPS